MWIDTNFNVNISSGGSNTGSLLIGVEPDDTRGITLTRVLVRLNLMPGSVDVSNLSYQRFALGIGVTDQEAFAAGVLPDPLTSTDQPGLGWVWRDEQAVIVSSSSALEALITRVHVDFKSQRKIDDFELYHIFENTNAQGTGAAVRVTGLVRCLFLLP